MEYIAPLVVNVILALVGLGVTGVLVSILVFIHGKTNAQQLGLLESIADAAVKAAEQGAIAGYVRDKKQSALKVASEMLKQVGLDVSPEVLDATIEAAVMRAFNYDYSKYEAKTAVTSDVVTQPYPAS